MGKQSLQTLRHLQRYISSAARTNLDRYFRSLPPDTRREANAFLGTMFGPGTEGVRILPAGSLVTYDAGGNKRVYHDFRSRVDKLVRQHGPNRTLSSFLPPPPKPPEQPSSGNENQRSSGQQQARPQSGQNSGESPSPQSGQPQSGSPQAGKPNPQPEAEEPWVPTPPAPPPPPKPLSEAEKQAQTLESLRQQLEDIRQQKKESAGEMAKQIEKMKKAEIKAARKRQSRIACKHGKETGPSIQARQRAAGTCGRLRKVSPKLRARVADLINQLVDIKGSAGDSLITIPVLSARKVVKRLVVRRPLGNAFKEDSNAGRPVTLFLPDVSPSCSRQAQIACDISNAAGYAGVSGSDVIVFPHSNGAVESEYVPWFNGQPKMVSRKEVSTLFHDLTLGQTPYEIRAVVAVGDHDAYNLYRSIAARVGVKRFVWLHNLPSRTGPTVVPPTLHGHEWPSTALDKTTMVVGCRDEESILRGLELSLH